MDNVALDDISKLYDVADSRAMREQILYALYQRKEPAATDKIIEIARRDTDPQIRQRAISLLVRRNDDRAKEWIKRLVENPNP
jgi:HEAT repeat protein